MPVEVVSPEARLPIETSRAVFDDGAHTRQLMVSPGRTEKLLKAISYAGHHSNHA